MKVLGNLKVEQKFLKMKKKFSIYLKIQGVQKIKNF